MREFYKKTFKLCNFHKRKLSLASRYHYGEWNNNQVSCDPCKERKEFPWEYYVASPRIALTVRLILRTLFVSFSICRWS